MSREGRDVEHDIDKLDHADAYYLIDEANDVRFAVCKSCLHVICVCGQEEGEPVTSRGRRYGPAAARHRDDQP